VIGGCAANCTSIAMELKRQGIEIELLAPMAAEARACLSAHPLAEIVRPLPEGGGGLMGKGLSSIWVLRRALEERVRQSSFDVVHSHSGTYPYAWVPLAAKAGRPVRLHSLYCPLGARGGVYSRWWERPSLVRTLFRPLDRVVAVTNNIRQSIEKAGVSPERIESIPMCVDTERFQPREHAGSLRYFAENGDSLRLLYIGNTSREKGLLQLIRAVKTLIDGGIRAFLIAAIENQSAVRQYAAGYQSARQLISELGIDSHVRFLGLVDRIEDLYAESDFLVIPWETSRGPSDYPMVALEAMAMGKCIVATPVGGCPELLNHGKAGVLAEGFSAGDITAAIRSLKINLQKRQAVAQAAVRKAGELSLSVSAKRMISLYERLLKTKERRD
jgi:glycosyltransferase involved in cell wall biosynthesis